MERREHKIGIVLFFLLLLFCGQVRADVDTLYPASNKAFYGLWTSAGCSNRWPCIDEMPSDEDTTYIYSRLSGEWYYAGLQSTDFSSIDSIFINVRIKKSAGFGQSNCWHIEFGKDMGEGFWSHNDVSGPLNIGTDYITHACSSLEVDGDGNPWTSSTLASHGFGLYLDSNIGASGEHLRDTQIFVIIYGTTEAPADKARQNILEGGITK